MKVFCLGAHKTGTTSIRVALTTLGFDVFPGALWYRNAWLQNEFYGGRYASLFALLGQYSGFEDSPFNHGEFYQELYARYPDARFILTVRDADHLIASHRRWLAQLKATVFGVDKSLETAVKLFWQQEYRQTNWLDDETTVRRIYEARNAAVIDFYKGKKDQLLVLDLEKEVQPWQAVCTFLGVPAPNATFPHVKRTQ